MRPVIRGDGHRPIGQRLTTSNVLQANLVWIVRVAQVAIPSQMIGARYSNERADVVEELAHGLRRASNGHVSTVNILLQRTEALVDCDPLPAQDAMCAGRKPRRQDDRLCVQAHRREWCCVGVVAIAAAADNIRNLEPAARRDLVVVVREVEAAVSGVIRFQGPCGRVTEVPAVHVVVMGSSGALSLQRKLLRLKVWPLTVMGL